MRRLPVVLLAVGLAACLLFLTGWRVWQRNVVPNEWIALDRPPRISPDYTGVAIPPNIAPLNFAVEESGTAYYVRIESAQGPSTVVHSGDGGIRIPLGPWKTLLAQNRGGPLNVEVYVRSGKDGWRRFEEFQWIVTEEEIDPYFAYRLMDPIFNKFQHLGIYQRNLEAYDESPVVFNAGFGMGCVNCHTFQNNRTDSFVLHLRQGTDHSVSTGMVLVRDDKAARVNTRLGDDPRPAGFTSWHPGGEMVAFSVNETVQYMHGSRTEVREVYDRNSDLAILDFRTGSVSTDPAIADPARLETFPCWSPDGGHLYFASAPNLWEEVKDSLMEDYKKVQYDLIRIDYDAETNTWGEPELLLAAAETGKSMVQPRASPDGRYLLFCMCDHGAFPAFRGESDLCLLDLGDRSYRRLDANSPCSESWHSWSSNSRWIVFSSRRDNELLAWPYLCYIDPSGQDHKPLLVPRKDPRFYDTCLKTFNLPELISGPVTVPEKELLRALRTATPVAATKEQEVPAARR